MCVCVCVYIIATGVSAATSPTYGLPAHLLSQKEPRLAHGGRLSLSLSIYIYIYII